MAYVGKTGNGRIKVIGPGHGSSGYYSSEVLKRDAGIFADAHIFFDHPTSREDMERPERSVRDLAGRLNGTPVYEAEGDAGPGVYAGVTWFGPYRDLINELGPHVGMSIRAMGEATQ